MPSIAVALAVSALVGCGGGSGTSGDTVAQVGARAITKTAISHWMGTLAGGDYNELSAGKTVPEGLASDPPRYSACVARLESAAAASPVKVGPAPTSLQLLTKCQQLYRALREQATEFLVRTQWQIALDHELGVTASNQEVLKFFAQSKATHPLLASEALVRNYLTSRRQTLSDYLYILKLDLLAQKLEQKLQREGSQAQAKVTEAERQWTGKTTCRAGYVVRHCKQYRGAPEYASTPPPSVLMEQVAALATGRCINRPACARQ